MNNRATTSILLILFFVVQVSAQVSIPKDSVTGSYSYTGIILVDSSTKAEIYTKAKGWILKTLKSNDNMTEMDDAQLNTIVGSGTIIIDRQTSSHNAYENGRLNFKVVLQFKEGRMKYTFENFTFTADMISRLNSVYLKSVTSTFENPTIEKKISDNIANASNAKLVTLIQSLKKEVTSTKDDW